MSYQLGILGIPLDDSTLSQMGEVERSFWLDFLAEAKQVIDEKKKQDETMPYTPTSSLQEKYQKAIADYDGKKYCQIRQLQEIFSF